MAPVRPRRRATRRRRPGRPRHATAVCILLALYVLLATAPAVVASCSLAATGFVRLVAPIALAGPSPAALVGKFTIAAYGPDLATVEPGSDSGAAAFATSACSVLGRGVCVIAVAFAGLGSIGRPARPRRTAKHVATLSAIGAAALLVLLVVEVADAAPTTVAATLLAAVVAGPSAGAASPSPSPVPATPASGNAVNTHDPTTALPRPIARSPTDQPVGPACDVDGGSQPVTDGLEHLRLQPMSGRGRRGQEHPPNDLPQPDDDQRSLAHERHEQPLEIQQQQPRQGQQENPADEEQQENQRSRDSGDHQDGQAQDQQGQYHRQARQHQDGHDQDQHQHGGEQHQRGQDQFQHGHDQRQRVREDGAGEPTSKRRAVSTAASASNSETTPKIYLGDSSQLAQYQPDSPVGTALQHARLMVNAKYHCLVCADCGVVVGATSSAIAYHLGHTHKARKANITEADHSALRTAATEHSLVENARELVLRTDDVAVHGLRLLNVARCSQCSWISSSVDLQGRHASEHAADANAPIAKADIRWTNAVAQQALSGSTCVAVTLPPLSTGDQQTQPSKATPAGQRPDEVFQAMFARPANLYTTADSSDDQEAAFGTDDHGASLFAIRMGWNLPLHACIASVAPELVSPISAAADSTERRVANAVSDWYKATCDAVAVCAFEHRRILERVASYSTDDDDGSRILASLERGSRTNYAATLAALVVFIHRADVVQTRQKLTPTKTTTTTSSRSSSSSSRSSSSSSDTTPLINVPVPLADAVEQLFANPRPDRVTAAVEAIFARTTGPADGADANASRDRLVLVDASAQMLPWFLRLRAIKPEGHLATPEDVGHWAVHLAHAARLVIARRTLDDPGHLTVGVLNDLLETVRYPNPPSAFDAVVSIRRAARAAATTARPQLSYVPGTNRASVRMTSVGKPIAVVDLAAVVRRLQQVVRAQLLDLTLGTPLVRIDDLTPAERREFFHATPGLTVIPDRSTPVLDRLARDPSAINVAGTGLNGRYAQRYLTASAKMVTHHVTLVHLAGGQPARAPELAQMSYRNTADGERNLFLSADHGSIQLQQRYSKTRKLAGHDLCISRFLDLYTSDLLLSYLAQVRPIEQAMVGELYGKTSSGYSAYDHLMFCRDGGAMTGETISSAFAATMASSVGMGFPVKLAEYRHVAIALARSQLKLSALVVHGMEALDRQAAHGTKVGMAVYGLEFGQHGRLEEEEQFLYLSSSWHKLLGLPTVDGLVDLRVPSIDNLLMSTTSAALASGGRSGAPSTALPALPQPAPPTASDPQLASASTGAPALGPVSPPAGT